MIGVVVAVAAVIATTAVVSIQQQMDVNTKARKNFKWVSK